MKDNKLVAFQWIGGKHMDMPHLLPLIPNDINHFVDVFGGAANVILKVPRCTIMTYNDLDGELVNFFRVLRDDKDALIEALQLTPVARGEYIACLEPPPDGITDMERARRFYVRARQTINGLGGTTQVSPRSWGRIVCNPSVNAQVTRWRNGVSDLRAIADCFANFQIENEPALKLIPAFDKPGVFFYCDPPYVVSVTSKKKNYYHHSMTDDDHAALADTLTKTKARVMVSGYPSDLYNSIYPESAGWRRIDHPDKWELSTFRYNPKKRAQCAWINYDPPAAGQEDLAI